MQNITARTIPHAYDQLMRLIWYQGRAKIDQRGDKIRELKHIWVEITTNDCTYPSFGPTTKRYGGDFAEGLINDKKAKAMGKNFDYAYGDRLHHTGTIEYATYMLQNDPETRRAVLPIFWSTDTHAAHDGHEVPCATQIYLDIEDDELNMTLMMRSNDVVGAFPSDIYGFRKLQAHIAKEVNVAVGKYFHYANSAHIILANDEDFMKQFIKTKPNWT